MGMPASIIGTTGKTPSAISYCFWGTVDNMNPCGCLKEIPPGFLNTVNCHEVRPSSPRSFKRMKGRLPQSSTNPRPHWRSQRHGCESQAPYFCQVPDPGQHAVINEIGVEGAGKNLSMPRAGAVIDEINHILAVLNPHRAVLPHAFDGQMVGGTARILRSRKAFHYRLRPNIQLIGC